MSSQQAHSIVLTEDSLKERELKKRINRIKDPNSDKIIASEFTETRIENEIDNERDLFNYNKPVIKIDTIIITKRSKP